MDINIKYDVNDVADNIKRDVKTALEQEFKFMAAELKRELHAGLDNLLNEIAAALDINDARKKERARRAAANALDKWSKEVLKR